MTKNSLSQTSSTYLQMHAENPVHWHPFGEEALNLAKKEKKMIFFSSGYAACHWCHVMERESFDNPSVAKVLNECYVSIKLDREQNPEIDAYLQGVSAEISGMEGWPLTAILTPDFKPIFATTYLPPGDAYGKPGLETLLKRYQDLWEENPDQLTELARKIDANHKQRLDGSMSTFLKVKEGFFVEALRNLEKFFDPHFGGFGGGNKFPNVTTLSFVFTEYLRTKEKVHKTMVEKTLDHMIISPLQDHIGGGFHRYATIHDWSLPHFEKMLSDQALLAPLLISAGLEFNRPSFLFSAKRIFENLEEDFKCPSGGFYHALDADVNESEGLYYLWEPEHFHSLVTKLAKGDAEFFFSFVRLNQKTPMSGLFPLMLAAPIEWIAGEMKTTPEKAFERLPPIFSKLKEVRKGRYPLKHDENILTETNALTASAYFKAYCLLGEKVYLEKGEKLLEFLTDAMVKPSHILHGICQNAPLQNGFLADYGALSLAYLDAYQATFDPYFVKMAAKMVDMASGYFWDDRKKSFFDTSELQGHAITPLRFFTDEPKPSGTSLIADALLRLGTLTGDDEDLEKAEWCLNNQGAFLYQASLFSGKMLENLDFFLRSPTSFTFHGDPKSSPVREMASLARESLLPSKILMCLNPEDSEKTIEIMPALEGISKEEAPALLICKNQTCSAPIHTLKELKNYLVDK